MKQVKTFFKRLFGLHHKIERSYEPLDLKQDLRIMRTVQPEETLGEAEWMKKFNVGNQYCIFGKRKPQETVSMMDIYTKTFVEGVATK
jgi:hypothetical protein